MVERVAGTADLVTADSEHVLTVLAECGAERLKLVPWGVDRGWLAEAKNLSPAEAARRAGLPAGRTIILSPRGTLELYEPGIVLRGLAVAAKSVPDLLGVIACDPSPLEPLQALAGELGIEDRVLFRPKWPHEEMPFVFRSASVCVSVPRSDSAPTSVLEAAALGVPVVVSDLPWTREEPYRQLRMEIVPAREAEALGRAVVRQFESGRDEENERVVAKYFDRDALFGSVEAEYERLAGRA
jgi:glycosyltransferase involved in cell wall biosynthesis